IASTFIAAMFPLLAIVMDIAVFCPESAARLSCGPMLASSVAHSRGGASTGGGSSPSLACDEAEGARANTINIMRLSRIRERYLGRQDPHARKNMVKPLF